MALLFAVFFVFNGAFSKGGSEEFLITEIMYNDSPEWIELVAQEEIGLTKKSLSCIADCQLKDFYICAKISKTDSSCVNSYPVYAIGSKMPAIEKNDFLIITKDPQSFVEAYEYFDGILLKSNFNLLENESASLAYSLDNKKTWKGILYYSDFFDKKEDSRSLERIDFDKSDNSKSNWQESYLKKGTPGEKSSIKLKYDQKIYINEIYPHLKSKDEKEFIELFNATSEDEILNGWYIEDKVGKKCVLDKRTINSNEYLVLKNDPENYCDIALNDTSEETVYLKDPNGDTVDQTYPYKSAKEGLSYSFDGKSWHWTIFLTPGEENILENIIKGKILIDEDVYENVYANFSIKGLSKKAKVTWDFGDGHKSYKQETKHKYKDKGKYDGSVKYQAGSEDVIENFVVTVEEFPRRKVRLITINANPNGSDTKNETITIENKSKKKINLLGWSIATGSSSKKLVNHPIREDFEIGKNKTKEITREISSFSLNNKKGKIELRYPDGEVASKVKYKKEDGIKEGEIYERNKDGWEWIRKITNDKLKIANKDSPDNEIESKSSVIGNQSVVAEMGNKSSVIVNQTSENNNQELEREAEKELDIEILKNHFEIEMLDLPNVLGEIVIREENGQYYFTPIVSEQEHYVVTFAREISSDLNANMNILLNGLMD
ncbi:MAG: hypothetical protein ACD_5C00179G0010 [uncultured bacterium]|nr:MAG: hypothetical protein ACD_5C00179G0010 [uncultured bacterium]